MNVSIFSLYWDNIDERVVKHQKNIMDQHNIVIQQHRINEIDHGEWMDWVIKRNNGLILFMDIDCIITNKYKAIKYITMASDGTLVGNIQCTSHMGPEIAKKEFAGPSFLCVHKEQWINLKSPSFMASPYGDVAQLVTDTWKQSNVSVKYLPVTDCEQPKWTTYDSKQSYGIGTTYGECVYHLFESCTNSNIDMFLRKNISQETH